MAKSGVSKKKEPATSPLRVELDRDREESIEKLKGLTGAKNLKQLVMYAFAALAWIVKGVSNGGRVILETSDGKMYELDADYLPGARTMFK